MSIIFFPREFIICFKSVQAKQVDLENSSLARSLRDLAHFEELMSGRLVANLDFHMHVAFVTKKKSIPKVVPDQAA